MSRKKEKKEEERKKLRDSIVLWIFIFSLLALLSIILIGVASPYGLENYFKALGDGFLKFLKELRFKADIVFRFFDSLKNKLF